ncbi:hypothetical protein GPECTOR_47g313 [Gonium pectorale]|uniref:Uncharacterized protein n=1 Tax=Gonium pectorale TaxID=33097 RepID=A0A150G892_GONPE|nr:hypothetical protein GPECTOR_47g313 [Gonium pectorale]|eukprot:KXZ46038.1 hypothetical protein GPECTOR_47g313 [Gonium pectorale]
MFGLAPIRTRAEPEEQAQPGACSSFASSRTRALLDEARKQQKHVEGSKKLSSDVKEKELAALSLLVSTLAELHGSINEHDNPGPGVAKRKVLIKVEKARRQVLATVREGARGTTESKKLFEEVERFIELRPDESLSPRQWSRPTPQPEPQRARGHIPVRKLRPTDSLCASIMGLAEFAEGRDINGQESPYSAVAADAAPAGESATAAAAASAAAGGGLRTSSDEQKAPAGAPLPPQQKLQTVAKEQQGPGSGQVEATAVRRALGNLNINGGERGGALVAGEKGSAVAVVSTQQQPGRQARDVGSSDGEDDTRPPLLLDVAQSSAATTMCNMDSCVTGPQRGPTGRTANGARRRSDERYQDGADDDDDDDEEDGDEVNSAEGGGRRYGDSPDHRVSLLGRMAGGAAAATTAATSAADAAAAAAAAAGSSTQPPLDISGLRAKYAKLTSGGNANMAVAALPPAAPAPRGEYAAAVTGPDFGQPAAGGSGRPSDGAQSTTDAAGTVGPVTPGAGAGHGPSPSVRALAEALRSQESILGNRSYFGVDPRCGSGSGHVPQYPSGPEPFTDETVPASAAAEELDAIDPRVGAAARHPATAAGLHHAAPPQPQPQQGYRPTKQPYGPPEPAGPASVAASSAAPGTSHPAYHAAAAAAAAGAQYHRHAQYQPHGPNPQQHHALAAATAAAAAHPFTCHQHPTLPLGSGPSSLRDYPLVPRQGHAHGRAGPGSDVGMGAAQAAMGPRYGASQPASGHQSLDSGRFPASATMTNWDSASIADTEPAPGSQPTRRGRRRRGGNGLFGLVRNVVGFVGVSVISGAAMVLGAAAVNTGLDEQNAANEARRGPRRGQRPLGRGGDELIPQRALQQLRSPDLLALGRG